MNVFLRPFSWPYFYPMSNLHFKSTMLLCLLSNKNTTHVDRSTKLNKKPRKEEVGCRCLSVRLLSLLCNTTIDEK